MGFFLVDKYTAFFFLFASWLRGDPSSAFYRQLRRPHVRRGRAAVRRQRWQVFSRGPDVLREDPPQASRGRVFEARVKASADEEGVAVWPTTCKEVTGSLKRQTKEEVEEEAGAEEASDGGDSMEE